MTTRMHIRIVAGALLLSIMAGPAYSGSNDGTPLTLGGIPSAPAFDPSFISSLPVLEKASTEPFSGILTLQTAMPQWAEPAAPVVPAPAFMKAEAVASTEATPPAAPASTQLPPADTSGDKALISDLSKISDPDERKAAFVALMLPQIEGLNDAILADRNHISRIRAELDAQEAVSADDLAWLDEISNAYKVAPGDFDELFLRVDVIPASIALSQAALESGWGTSRLARKKLSLFGQTNGADGFASFRSLAGGISAYFRNLNTHSAYADFREARALARQDNSDLDGYDLAAHLTTYSELGNGYVKKVRVLMRSNDFHLLQEAMLTTE